VITRWCRSSRSCILESEPKGERTTGSAGSVREVAIALALASAFAAAWLLVWYGGRVLLLCFAGILFAIFLNGLSSWVSHQFKMSYRPALAVVTVSLVLIIVLGVGLLAPEIQRQTSRLTEELPRAWEQLHSYLGQFSLGRKLLESGFIENHLNRHPAEAPGTSHGLIFSTVRFLVDLLVIAFVGFYFAVDPDLYVCGAVRLLPHNRRERIQQVLVAVRTTLGHWLRGRLLLMLVNGCVTALVLWLMGIPMALLLGVLSGTLDFIPNFGPIIAAVPAILIALQQSPQAALYVTLFFLIYQNLDGYVLTPLVQKWTIAMPEAVTIIVQVLLGVLLGGLGLLLAVPLVAAGMVMVKMLYMEDVLHEPVSLMDQKKNVPRGKE
jgi:predicted PurR-regulated permease PerM